MIGRKQEIERLKEAYESPKPELVAIFGRRRVGKTYLIGSFFAGKIDFELTGLQNESREYQLRNFAYSLKDARKIKYCATLTAGLVRGFSSVERTH